MSSSCVENGAPVAVLVAPASPEAFAMVELDGTASTDPDAVHGDRIEAFRWSVESRDATCDPPAVSTTAAMAQVRFQCAGAFRVKLVAMDTMGIESRPAYADLATVPPARRPLVTSPDRSVNHSCSGSPLICTTEGGDLSLSAALGTGVHPSGAVAYSWSVDAAGGLDEHRSVTFLPSANVANPTVRIAVDETAVAALVDDWVLRVTARDDAGLVGEAATRVSVLNRPPVLVSAVPTVGVDHTYSSGAYRASATASRWQDPDGDPLVPAGPTGNAVCSSWSLRADGTAVVDCAQVFDGNPDRLASFVATHTVTLLPRDPSQAADAPQSMAITIRNRPVSAGNSTVPGSPSCTRGTSADACCEWDTSEPGHPICLERQWHCSGPRAQKLAPALTDPDGDPLRVTWTAGLNATDGVCLPGVCKATSFPVGTSVACSEPSGSQSATFTATDGLTTGSGRLTFSY